MTDITAAVAKAMDNLVASGRIEKSIEDALARTISDCIQEHTRHYSDFGKAVSNCVPQLHFEAVS